MAGVVSDRLPGRLPGRLLGGVAGRVPARVAGGRSGQSPGRMCVRVQRGNLSTPDPNTSTNPKLWTTRRHRPTTLSTDGIVRQLQFSQQLIAA
jgi:hypothetical protein